jgi:hypothetical protein
MSIILDMMREHWFWGILTLACLVWYSTITVYVGFKGFKDIRSMLKRLGEQKRP